MVGKLFMASVLLIGAAFTASAAKAQPDAAPGPDREYESPESPESPESADEEIVVVGQRTLSALRAEISLAEDRVHELFNALNDDDEYDIHCHRETRTGTNISQRVCKANFVDGATSAEGQATLAAMRGEMGSTRPPAAAVIRRKNKILREKLTAFVSESDELREAVEHFNERLENYETVSRQMRDSDD
jgi:hypothetical protein